MKGKQVSTFAAICLYFFFSGVEYAVILPTLNLYLLSMDAESYYIGLVLSAFSFGGLISAPVYGRITDKTGSSKVTVMISNLFEIGGNILYLLAKNPLMVLLSRFLAGIGSGSGSSIFGMISRSTSKEQRTASFSVLMSLRQFGLLVGPACNLFLRQANFYIGSVYINTYNVQGFFMAILWALHVFIMAVGYFELPQSTENMTAETNNFEHGINSGTEDIQSNITVQSNSKPNVVIRESKSFWVLAYKDLFREEVIVCLFINFNLMFVQTGVETLLTPLSLQLFGWKELANSIFFSIAGAIIIVSFITVGLLSKKFSDRLLLLIGSAIMTGLYIYFLVYIIFASQNRIEQHLLFALFVLHSILLIFDLPFIWVPQAALFSKITSAKNQAFNQGIRMLAMRLGQIMGPLWAGSLLSQLPLMISVNLALIALLTVMISMSYKRLIPENEKQVLDVDANTDPNERTPLLSGANGINA
uniref:Major facilitator superfamily domain-containing protein 8-like n=1 Tax=Phallusia mammillata TaxID=59560 RepID=A0A6F9DK38_9ASCI|nr:major facilitator superfamily domain-containing protein 8-like [Phallusia mammillata]